MSMSRLAPVVARLGPVMVCALLIGPGPVLAQQSSRPAATPAPAQNGQNNNSGGLSGVFGGGRAASTDQPIDISSNALEIQQAKQVAIFTGQVEAIQGDLRLKADTLKVHYRQKSAAPVPGAKAPAKTPAPAAAAQDESMGAISRIEAIGHVFISSPTETAQGETGDYDVDKKIVVLVGNVVITRGQSVLRGNRATVDMVSGRSTMEVKPGERVRGLFVPDREAQQQNQRPAGTQR